MANKGSFVKGDPRINRKGRPKLGNTLAAKFRDALSEPLSETPEGKYTTFDSIVDSIVKKAMKGDLASADWLIARGYGKMIERIEGTNVNQNYDFSNLDLETRMKLLETLKSDRETVIPSDLPDSE